MSRNLHFAISGDVGSSGGLVGKLRRQGYDLHRRAYGLQYLAYGRADKLRVTTPARRTLDSIGRARAAAGDVNPPARCALEHQIFGALDLSGAAVLLSPVLRTWHLQRTDDRCRAYEIFVHALHSIVVWRHTLELNQAGRVTSPSGLGVTPSQAAWRMLHAAPRPHECRKSGGSVGNLTRGAGTTGESVLADRDKR